jgi:RNA polymerase sigma factor (sigma-70 family)
VLAGEPDERLVALARDGDERAFVAIVERYRAPLLQYCRGFLSPAAAEDALQQTFINAHAALTRADGRAPVTLRPWLYRVAHNASLNVARDPQSALAQLPEDIDGVERPDEALVRNERFRRVVGAVRSARCRSSSGR